MPILRLRSHSHATRFAGGLILGLALAGCAVGPVYREPGPAVAATWHATLPHGGRVAAMEDWWRQFDDPVLSGLIEQAEADSPSLTQAWASIEKARATLTSNEAAGLPSLTGSGAVTRSREQSSAQTTSTTTRSGGLDASWEIDLFGKVRRNVEAARARIDARIDDWHNARVTLAAEVADTYVQYRACGLLADAYARELASLTQTEKSTAAAVAAGFNAPSDAMLARASVASTRSTLVSQQAQCELLVKSLVALTGAEESALRGQLAQGGPHVPQPRALEVRAVPAEVLRQRPDLASLERELAAASAEIGAAQADLYPSLSLSGSVGLSATGGSSSITTWSFGPSLSIPLFDGGQRRAAVRSAEASYVSAHASWRAGVRSVVKEVEQALVNLDSTARRADDAALAAQEYRRYFNSVEANWRAGNVSLLTLEEARRSALSAEITLLALQQSRVQYWIALYKALGGGWQPGIATAPPSATHDTVQGGSS
ncbi:efflux transporter outer membrane subunit [Parasulfuritortus cantonensis]|uniref:Efflux transporter outer membrane subunit n=1 Tax=Parasulfuritortus cantonensis TaxID=2528202 RepID=A0A4R1BQV2_9PROT|nr:efflux transporter outer membrane subunit [Parasulfuritortus cantonensis]TCJ20139.1 efflux transporter outer membrane subunit [Parasulfuritortus cantonensis]